MKHHFLNLSSKQPINWKREGKKVFKRFISRKGVLPSFGLLVYKVFKYAITSVPLAVAILNPTLYQPDKAGLRNYISIYQEVLVMNIKEM